jgi:hypothetical protein
MATTIAAKNIAAVMIHPRLDISPIVLFALLSHDSRPHSINRPRHWPKVQHGKEPPLAILPLIGPRKAQNR